MKTNSVWLGTAILLAAAVAGLAWFWASNVPSGGAGNENAGLTETRDADIKNPVPRSTFGSSAVAGSRVFENGVYVTIVHLTASGFVPKSVIVESGEEVRFVNKTSLSMRIGAHEDNLSSAYYSGFMQPEAEGRNGEYQLAFTQPGIFTYYNVSGGTERPPVSGTIFVR